MFPTQNEGISGSFSPADLVKMHLYLHEDYGLKDVVSDIIRGKNLVRESSLVG